MNYKRLVLSACALVLAGLTLAACKQEEENNDDEILLLGVAAAFLPQNPGSCSFTFGSTTVPIQEYSLAANSSSAFPAGFTTAFRRWAAIKIPAAANGTTVAFNYSPFYDSTSLGNIYLVYEASGCAIDNSTTTDWNRTADLGAARTPTNYTVSGNTFTFNATAAGKNFVIVSANRTGTGTEAVARVN
jgi:hypothetical protein